MPGSEVGGSRVRLKGERDKPWRVSATRNNDGDVKRDKPWRVSATRNNDGDVSTGEQQMGLGLDWDSPLGLGASAPLARRVAATRTRAIRMRATTSTA